jgi:hypothetical protein
MAIDAAVNSFPFLTDTQLTGVMELPDELSVEAVRGNAA